MTLYIKSVCATGPNVEDALVSFTKGFNLIEGHSNKGKTMIIQFIEYVLGGKGKLSLNIDSTKYTTVLVNIQTDQGKVTLKRNIITNTSNIEVVSEDERLLSGNYTANNSTEKKANIGIALLRLIQIPTDLFLPKNERREPGHVSFNVIKPLWLLSENDSSKEKSALLPEHGSGLFLSSLAFLLSGRQIDTYDWKEIEKRRAVREYISGQIESAENKKGSLKQKSSQDKNELQEKLEALNNQLDEIDNEVAEKINQNKKYFENMSVLDDKLTVSKVTLSRYQSLKEQYISDIKRLNFIADGEAAFTNIEEPMLCPVCGQVVSDKEKDSSHIDAAKVELKRTVALLKDLEQATNNVIEEKLHLENQYEEIRGRYGEIQEDLNEKLYPKIKQMKATEESYRLEIETISKIEMLDTLLEEWTTKIQRLTEEGIPEKNVKYKPKDEFGEEFYKDMGEILDSFLKIGNYPKHTVATFDKSSFDIMINGKKKSVSHGKGFRSYLNSITVTALSEYINKNAVYKPEFLIIDTPLEGLSEKDIDQPSESMRSGIFDLFLKRGESYQIIVVENPDHLPKDIDFEDENINLISYENEEGFLKEI